MVTGKKWKVSARPCLKEAINRSLRLSAGGVQRVLHYPHEQPRTTRREHTARLVVWDDKSIANSPENVEKGWESINPGVTNFPWQSISWSPGKTLPASRTFPGTPAIPISDMRSPSTTMSTGPQAGEPVPSITVAPAKRGERTGLPLCPDRWQAVQGMKIRQSERASHWSMLIYR